VTTNWSKFLKVAHNKSVWSYLQNGLVASSYPWVSTSSDHVKYLPDVHYNMCEQYAIGYCTVFVYLHSVPAADSKSSYQQILCYLYRAFWYSHIMWTNKIHHCYILFNFSQYLLYAHLSNLRAHVQGDGCNKFRYGIIYVYMYGTPWFIKASSKIRPHPLKSTHPPHTHSTLCVLLILLSLHCSSLFVILFVPFYT